MKRRKRRNKYNFIISFCITLTFVTLAGLFLVFSYLWIAEDVRAETKSGNTRIENEKILRKDNTDANPKSHKNEPGNPENTETINPSHGEERMLEDNVFVKETAREDCVTLAFAGDILFDPNYAIMVTLLQRGGDIASGIEPAIIEEMKNVDIMMINNEFPYSDRGEPLPEKQFTFRAKPSYVSYLEQMGVDIVSLANNHAYDYGEEAFVDTLQTLKDAGIHYVGAGIDAKEAARPVYYIVNDMKIAFVSATQIERHENPDTKEATENSPGVLRCLDGTRLMQVVREAEGNSDFVIAYVHWGTENQEETDWGQENQAKELVEAGADLIVGDHPHILQKVDIINGVPVFYSMGNFWFNSRTMDTGLLKVTLAGGKLQSCQFIPCIQNDCRTTMLSGEEKERVLELMRSMSENVSIDAEGYINF